MRSLLLLVCTAALPGAVVRHDVIIYGGTAGGAAAAVAAARSGANVGLVEPGAHIGGILSGGLGRTDMDRQENVIGGIALQFFQRAGRHYGKEVAWTLEPSVAERILNQMLREAGVKVYFDQQLAEANGIDREGDRIVRFRTIKGDTFEGRVLYIRAARRMLGEYVVTQHDLQTRRRKYDAIGMAGYNIDIREVQWVARTVYRFPSIGKELLMARNS